LPEPAPLHPVSRLHLEALSDEIGIMQHASGSRPDPAHGYCTDDVARALQVDLLHGHALGWPAVAASAVRSLRFLGEAFDPSTGRFRNFRAADRSWLEGPASEDSHGRAMLALGETVALAGDAGVVSVAAGLFAAALPAAVDLTALRARASTLLGCDAIMRAAPAADTAVAYRRLAAHLRAAFSSRTASAWPWPESSLTYENGLLPRALIVAGGHLGDPALLQAGLDVLGWLIHVQTAPAGHLSPIGNQWWPYGGQKPMFDQQPIEATGLLLAAEAAWLATGAGRYREAMEQAYAWFLGDNDLGLAVVDARRGAGYDGLTPSGVNSNQGAESTLMWLLALESTRAMRAEPPAPVEPSDRRLLEASLA
jgi:hypothetical protein